MIPEKQKKSSRQIFFDIETTGLKYVAGHKIVELAALEFVDMEFTGKMVHLYFNPERDVPEEVVRIHGLNNDFLDDKPLFKDSIGEFLSFIENADEILAHNGKNFDYPFVDYELMQNGFEPMKTVSKIKKFTDTLVIARAVANSKKNTLDALCEKYGVNATERNLHGAVIDCKLLAGVWYKMTAHIDFNKPDLSERQEEIVRLTSLPPLKMVNVTAEDTESHKKYLEDWQASSPKAQIVYQGGSSTKAAFKI